MYLMSKKTKLEVLMQNSKVLVTQRPYVDLAVLKYRLIVELTCGNSLGRRYTNVMTAFLLFLPHGRHYLYSLLPFFNSMRNYITF